MIGSLRGALVERALDGEALLEVGGVGYRVTVAAATAARLGGAGAPTFLWIHHHIREDQQALYGFASRDRARLLRGCCSAPTASARPWRWPSSRCTRPPSWPAILADDDLAALCLVPGVGRKTAARLVVELKSRLLDDDGRMRLVDSGRRAERHSARWAPTDRRAERVRQWRRRPRAPGLPGTELRTRTARAASTPRAAATGRPPSRRGGTLLETPRSIVRQALAELGYGAGRDPPGARRARPGRVPAPTARRAGACGGAAAAADRAAEAAPRA